MVKEASEFFASSNGDRWYLEQGEDAAEPTVIHRANMASGGAETRWSVVSFFRVAGNHPQGQALRDALAKTRLTETAARVAPTYPWTPKTKASED